LRCLRGSRGGKERKKFIFVVLESKKSKIKALSLVSVFIPVALKYNLKIVIVIPLALLFLLRITFALQGLLCFCMKFSVDFSISMKNDIGILIGVALNLQAASSNVAIFMILILPIHEYQRSFYLLMHA
jgi:hypothetical protein